jgi:nicotinamide-nucleotide amidase
VVTGSELVRGDRRDANGPYLATDLSNRGIEPARVVIVGDRPEELFAAIEEGLEADLLVTSGGLGPTHDDRTVEAVATATGRALVVDGALEAEIEAFSRRAAERLGRPYADFGPGVTKQATLPEGAVALGLAGTAPALLVEHDSCVVVVLPGPPVELRRLWPRALEHPALQALLARAETRGHRALRFFGPSESAVARRLGDAGGESDGLETTVCARDLEIHVDMYYSDEAAEGARRLEQALTAAFAEDLFAVDDERGVEELVLDGARQRNVSLATAESCTGGMIAARLTAVPGASAVYVGGVVAYSDEIKAQELGVPEEVLREHGAVSAETAAAMAEGAAARLRTDLALAVTGIAGPDGGTEEKPVGLVFIAVAGDGTTSVERFHLPGDRDSVRARATAISLHMLRRVLMPSASLSRRSPS